MRTSRGSKALHQSMKRWGRRWRDSSTQPAQGDSERDRERARFSIHSSSRRGSVENPDGWVRGPCRPGSSMTRTTKGSAAAASTVHQSFTPPSLERPGRKGGWGDDMAVGGKVSPCLSRPPPSRCRAGTGPSASYNDRRVASNSRACRPLRGGLLGRGSSSTLLAPASVLPTALR